MYILISIFDIYVKFFLVKALKYLYVFSEKVPNQTMGDSRVNTLVYEHIKSIDDQGDRIDSKNFLVKEGPIS